jgi:1-acyl-sn-glycerol-3-phosphate acyltransferase
LVALGLLFGTSLLRPLIGRERAEAADLSIVAWVLGRILAAARLTTGFRMELQEPPVPLPFDQAEPVLVLARHGGVGDSFALAHLLIDRYRRRPRVVLKDLLIWDPMLDVALSRMGAGWIGGSSVLANRNVIEEVARSARPGDAVLLFPEGANWTPQRHQAAISRLRRAGRRQALKTTVLMDHVLPPKAGGVLTCLAARPELPVVIMAHTGLDRITSARALWQALPFKSAMRLRWWIAAPPPGGDKDRVAWLTAEWAVVDEWIDGASPDPQE